MNRWPRHAGAWAFGWRFIMTFVRINRSNTGRHARFSKALPVSMWTTSPHRCATLRCCPHAHRHHKAKGMCDPCYSKNLESHKKVTNCPHVDKRHFKKGMCQLCFFKELNSGKKITECLHCDKPSFRNGMCESCYRKILKRQKKVTNCPHFDKP